MPTSSGDMSFVVERDGWEVFRVEDDAQYVVFWCGAQNSEACLPTEESALAWIEARVARDKFMATMPGQEG